MKIIVDTEEIEDIIKSEEFTKMSCLFAYLPMSVVFIVIGIINTVSHPYDIIAYIPLIIGLIIFLPTIYRGCFYKSKSNTEEFIVLEDV